MRATKTDPATTAKLAAAVRACDYSGFPDRQYYNLGVAAFNQDRHRPEHDWPQPPTGDVSVPVRPPLLHRRSGRYGTILSIHHSMLPLSQRGGYLTARWAAGSAWLFGSDRLM